MCDNIGLQFYLNNQNLNWQDSVQRFLGTALRLASLPERQTSNIPFTAIVERSSQASLAWTGDLQPSVQGDLGTVPPSFFARTEYNDKNVNLEFRRGKIFARLGEIRIPPPFYPSVYNT